MHDVFISYSSAELAQAETVRNILEENGIPCWMAPRDIPGGSNYTKEIPIAIRNCQAFVLILSQNAQNSHWVLKELDTAVNCGKVILPFMLEDCALNDEFNFLLTGAQRYAAYQKKAEALETLISRVRAVTDPASRTAADDGEQKPTPAPAVKKEPLQKKEYFGVAHCPACGGSELVEVRQLKRVDSVERLYMLAAPAGAVVGVVVSFVLSVIITMFADNFMDYFWIAILICAAAGWVLGSIMEKKAIRRRRVRRKMSLQTFRCSACEKVFTPDTITKQL